MKEKMRKILVAIGDLACTPRAQLRKAATIARASGARIELFHAITEPVIVDVLSGITRDIDREHDEVVATRQLERLRRSEIFESVPVTCVALRDYPAHEAIARRARETGADLVIAATQQRTAGERFLLTNTDWELIRHCATPLLLVKSSRDYKNPVVLTGVDPFHAHAKPTDLDTRLIESGSALASMLSGKDHLFHASPPLTTGGPWLPAGVIELHAEQAKHAFNDLAQKAGIPAARRHFRVGEVAPELANAVKKTGASVVVMGAVSRSGLKRLFIGNTAERVLDQLTCDVLIIKPQGFAAVVAKRPVIRSREVA